MGTFSEDILAKVNFVFEKIILFAKLFSLLTEWAVVSIKALGSILDCQVPSIAVFLALPLNYRLCSLKCVYTQEFPCHCVCMFSLSGCHCLSGCHWLSVSHFAYTWDSGMPA